MDLEEVAVYRRNLQNYRFYKSSLKRHKDKLLELETKELGLHSPQFGEVAVQGSQDEYIKACKRFDLIEDINKEKEEIKKYESLLGDIDMDLVMMNLEISNVIKNVYCLKKTTIYKESVFVNWILTTLPVENCPGIFEWFDCIKYVSTKVVNITLTTKGPL